MNKKCTQNNSAALGEQRFSDGTDRPLVVREWRWKERGRQKAEWGKKSVREEKERETKTARE